MGLNLELKTKLPLLAVVCITCLIYTGDASAQPVSRVIGQVDVDIPGGDYARINLSPNLCESLCNSDVKCKAWTFIKSNVAGPEPICWLKSSVGKAVRRAGMTSGVKAPASPPKLN